MTNKSRRSFSALVAMSWALLAMALLSGCITQSIHPIYDSRTLIFDDGLVGTWEIPGEEESWLFEQDGPRRYKLFWSTKYEADVEMEARLVQIGEARFLDIYFDSPPEGVGELASVFMLPVHTVLRVDAADGDLKLSALGSDWLERHLKANPGAIAHTFTDGRVVLTAGTDELQRFYTDLLGEPKAWEEVIDMKRAEAGINATR